MKHLAKQLSNSIMGWIPLLPNWTLTKQARAINHKLMSLYGYWDPEKGFIEL